MIPCRHSEKAHAIMSTLMPVPSLWLGPGHTHRPGSQASECGSVGVGRTELAPGCPMLSDCISYNSVVAVAIRAAQWLDLLRRQGMEREWSPSCLKVPGSMSLVPAHYLQDKQAASEPSRPFLCVLIGICPESLPGGLEKAKVELLYRAHTSSWWKMQGRAA